MDDIELLRELIGSAQRIVAFTGAGISTESGIPDFRSPGGIWTRYKPIYFDDFMSSDEMRRESWRRKFATDETMLKAEPNAGHRAQHPERELTDLRLQALHECRKVGVCLRPERMDLLADDRPSLHTRARSRNLHGVGTTTSAKTTRTISVDAHPCLPPSRYASHWWSGYIVTARITAQTVRVRNGEKIR